MPTSPDMPEAPKRFLLFRGNDYEESGGWNDLFATYDTAEEACRAGEEGHRPGSNWWHVIDKETGEEITAAPPAGRDD